MSPDTIIEGSLHPMEKKCKKAKWLSGEALQIAVKRREAKSKGEKERYKHLSAEFQRIARRDKKAFLSDQCKEKGIPGLISFRMDCSDLLTVQGTLKSLLQHHSSKASILRRSALFTVQL